MLVVEACEHLVLGGRQVGAAQRLADADELAVVLVDVAQRAHVVALVRLGDPPDHRRVGPPQHVRVVRVVGPAVGPHAANAVVHAADRARESLGHRGRPIGDAHEERDRVAAAGRGALGIDAPGRDAVLVALQRAGVVVAHPREVGVERLDRCRRVKAEREQRRVLVHVPDRAVGAEPAGVAGRLGELDVGEEVATQLAVEGLLVRGAQRVDGVDEPERIRKLHGRGR